MKPHLLWGLTTFAILEQFAIAKSSLTGPTCMRVTAIEVMRDRAGYAQTAIMIYGDDGEGGGFFALELDNQYLEANLNAAFDSKDKGSKICIDRPLPNWYTLKQNEQFRLER